MRHKLRMFVSVLSPYVQQGRSLTFASTSEVLRTSLLLGSGWHVVGDTAYLTHAECGVTKI